LGLLKKRLNWPGYVERMAEDNIVQKIKRWKPMSKRQIGRLKTRWEDDVLDDMQLEESNLYNIYRQYTTIYQYNDIIYTIRSHYGYMFRPQTVNFRPVNNILKVQ